MAPQDNSRNFSRIIDRLLISRSETAMQKSGSRSAIDKVWVGVGYAVVLVALIMTLLGLAPMTNAAAPGQPANDAIASSTVAVIIGNQDYHRGVPDVPFAGNDAQAMHRFLTEQMSVQAANTLVLDNANLEMLTHVFGDGGKIEGRLGQMVRPGVSDVVVYYSGHGVPGVQDGRAYLLPINADPNQPVTQAYALDDLYDGLTRINARSITVYLDASFTGRSPGGALIGTEPRIPPAVAPFDLPDGIAVITASAPEQMAAWDRESRHGLFTEYLMRGLYGAADVWGHGNGDGDVTLEELKTYLDKEMTFAARRDHGRVQSVDVSGMTDFVLARFDPSDPPLRPLVSGQDFAATDINEVPLPEDVLPTEPEKVFPALTEDAIEPLPVPESQPIAASDLSTFEMSEETQVPSSEPVQTVSLGDFVPAEDIDADEGSAEVLLWREVGNSSNPEDLKIYLLSYPNGRFADVAKIRFRRILNDLKVERQLDEREYRQLNRIKRLKARNKKLQARLRDQRLAAESGDWYPPPPPRRLHPRNKPRFDGQVRGARPFGRPPPRSHRGF